jgi:hypothetical protein
LQWEQWVDAAARWAPFFKKIENLEGIDLVASLRALNLVSERDVENLGRLQRAPKARAIPVPGFYTGSDDDIALLALAFALVEPGALAVPYARRTDA